MVELPSDLQADAPGVKERTQLLHDFGALLTMWSELEIAMEIAIRKLTGMSALQTSIVVGSLQFGTKKNILSSLLKEAGNEDQSKAIKDLVDFAKRNALVHSAVAAEDDYSKFVFFFRSVKEKYHVKTEEFTAASFHQHFLRFRELHDAALQALNVTPGEMNEYGHGARFEGLATRA